MRSYLDIIIDLKDGLKPDYEEVRLACLMANSLLFFADHDIERLIGYGTDKEKSDLASRLTKSSYEGRFFAKRKSPEEYLGNLHPDHPDQKASMAMSEKIHKNFLKHQEKICA